MTQISEMTTMVITIALIFGAVFGATTTILIFIFADIIRKRQEKKDMKKYVLKRKALRLAEDIIDNNLLLEVEEIINNELATS